MRYYLSNDLKDGFIYVFPTDRNQLYAIRFKELWLAQQLMLRLNSGILKGPPGKAWVEEGLLKVAGLGELKVYRHEESQVK